MNDPKQEKPGAASGQAASGAKKVEKVQSSRYEWESKSTEGEAPPRSKAARPSLMTSLRAWLKKVFTGNRDFFDKDDDPTPSAA
jgi:hypothetical protein